eukprot:TRINITY_DN502_c0_g1_i1.p1 TRINITY_DN502_c0_g1~~TRINITY_DN502_c0_g1_i1.p1  ORF type:complete len:372 (-),score=93.37 TRINITY_DN502_c0_g1_i1:47-1162(-)
MGGSMSDMFYPDNPNRRARAEQLKANLENIRDLYNRLDNEFDQKSAEYQEAFDMIVQKMGFESEEQLQQKVKDALDGDAYRQYQDMIKGLDRARYAENVLWGITTLAGAVGLVVVSIGALLGPIGFMAGIAVVGEITAILGAIAFVFSIIEGAVERSELRDAINKLFNQRYTSRQALGKLQAMNEWLDGILLMFRSIKEGDTTEERVNALLRDHLDTLNETLGADMHKWDGSHTEDVLREQDRNQGAWTNEDPGYPSVSRSFMVMPEFEDSGELPTLNVSVEGLVPGKNKVTLQYVSNSSPEDVTVKILSDGQYCVCKNGQIEVDPESNGETSDCLFELVGLNLTSGHDSLDIKVSCNDGSMAQQHYTFTY